MPPSLQEHELPAWLGGGSYRPGAGKGWRKREASDSLQSSKRPSSASSVSSVDDTEAPSPVSRFQLPVLQTAPRSASLLRAIPQKPPATPISNLEELTPRPRVPSRLNSVTRAPTPPARRSTGFPHLAQHGFRMDPFSHASTQMQGHVLRRAALPPIQTILSAPKNGSGALPTVPPQAVPSTTCHTSQASMAVHNLTFPDAAPAPNGQIWPFYGAFLGRDGCLTTPSDLAAFMEIFEQLAQRVEQQDQQLKSAGHINALYQSPARSAAEAVAQLRSRGPDPNEFDPALNNSTTRAKRAQARGFYNLLREALGGQKAFQKWLVNEMERALGVSGLAEDLRIFDREWIEELLANEKLHGIIRRILNKEHRPSRLAFALRTSNIAQKDLNKLRPLNPGFFPGPNQLRKERKSHLAKFQLEWCPGGQDVVQMTTELSPEEEVARSQQEASEAQAADAALQQEAAEQAGRDFAVGADSASDGSLTDASRDSEWDSDGELADTKSAEEEARPGYGVVDMRNAHQVMVITQAPGILTRILDTLTAGVGFWVQLFYTNLRYPSPSAARAPAPGVGFWVEFFLV
jgi:hypothetical protein